MAIRASGPHPDQPAVHPDIVVIVPEPALAAGESDPFHPPVIVGAGPVCLNDVLRLAMIGTVSTLTVDDLGRPLNLGRKQRLASHAQWIALTMRDHGCVAPGCDRASPTTSADGNETEAPPISRTSPIVSTSLREVGGGSGRSGSMR